MSFSVRTTDIEFEVAFAILQFCIRALRTFMTVQPSFVDGGRRGWLIKNFNLQTGGLLERRGILELLQYSKCKRNEPSLSVRY